MCIHTYIYIQFVGFELCKWFLGVMIGHKDLRLDIHRSPRGISKAKVFLIRQIISIL